MLMEVKSQLYATLLSIKYALQRELLNKFTFISNIVFMIINNGCFIIQWIILYSLKDNVGGYSFKQVLLLWGVAAFTYGLSRFIFKEAFSLPDIINSGKLDNYLVQPKNVLISCITSSVEVSALGDILYGFIMIAIFGPSLLNVTMFIICGFLGALTITSISIIFSSLSFWFGRTEMITNTVFYTFLPLGITAYVPVQLISNFDIKYLLFIIFGTAFFVALAFIIFYKGLKRYSSANLMNVRI